MIKIGIITSKNRAAAFEQRLAKYDLKIICNEDIDFRATLKMWDQAGFEAAIIDDVGIEKQQAMIDGMRFIANAPRDEHAKLRTIFLASSKRENNDPVFSVLASSGVYDLILPSQDDPWKKMHTLIAKPAKRGDVVTYLDRVEIGSINVTSTEGASTSRKIFEHAPKYSEVSAAGDKSLHEKERIPEAPSVDKRHEKESTPQEIAAKRSQHRTVVGVIGPIPRCGCSHLVQTIARCAVLAGHKVAMLVNGIDFKRFKKLYPNDLDPSKRFVRISGVDIYCGFNANFAESINYNFIVIDFGVLRYSSKEEIDQLILRELVRTDLRFVQIPLGTPQELELVKAWLADIDLAILADLAIVTYGARKDLFERIKKEVHKKSPKTQLYCRGYQPWPLGLSGIPESIGEALSFKATKKTETPLFEAKEKRRLALRILGGKK